MKRTLGKSDIKVSALGMGCWAIGGHFLLDGKPDGWGAVDDNESIRAIQQAIALGVNFFDTADAYGTGHSEEVLGRAIKGQRDKVVIATKFGYTYDREQRALIGTNTSAEYIRWACQQSLQRLGTDYIDLYQLHVGGVPFEESQEIWETLDALQQEGLIRSYGWSTWDAESARAFATHTKGVAIQHPTNVLLDAPAMFEVCEQYGLSSINNSPLAMGLLSGKFNRDTQLSDQDVRGSGHSWVAYFENGKPRPEFLSQLEAIREILTSNGRTLVQGALAWHWARSPQSIPIPGFKNSKQLVENVEALRFGPLSPEQIAEIDHILGRKLEQSAAAS